MVGRPRAGRRYRARPRDSRGTRCPGRRLLSSARARPSCRPAADGRAVGRAITWLDRRAAAETAAAARAVGRAGWTVNLLGPIVRLSRTDPATYSEARWFLAAWDHVALRLSGLAAAALQDPADAVTVAEAARAGLDERAAPPPVRAGTVIGGLRPDAAMELGLPAGLPVVAGVNDAIATFLGAGLTRGRPGHRHGRHVRRLRALRRPAGLGAAAVDRPRAAARPPLRRRRDGGHGQGARLVRRRGARRRRFARETLLDEAAATPPGAGGLVFLPYLAGERWPLHDPAARGAFVGLTLHHGRGHLARAVLEAAAYALRHVAAPAVAAGLPFTELRVTGGTAASRALEPGEGGRHRRRGRRPGGAEASLAGAAILAAVGIGPVPDALAGIEALVRAAERLAPDRGAPGVYDRVFAEYEELHRSLAPANAALGALDTHGTTG